MCLFELSDRARASPTDGSATPTKKTPMAAHRREGTVSNHLSSTWVIHQQPFTRMHAGRVGCAGVVQHDVRPVT